ncbi:HWE histidine kinase domain-containing protein [Allorhizobium undicola]|uniref:HWE histidine kinase domain-containing protein n=1 Tax=Allorhizobium undicola TaxID=78527 RepID=UPI000AEE5D61|nr:HWE histidine kinase domain-containing protein [Allorhizobium undicola]
MRLRSKLDRLPSFKAMDRPFRVHEHVMVCCATVLVFLAVLALRFWLDTYLNGTFPYVTFFPAVLLVGFVFGVGPGALMAVLGGLASWYFFIPPYFSFEVSLSTTIAMLLYCFVVITDLGLTALMMRAYRAEKLARAEVEMLAEQQEVMARELDHRLKNVFATINAIISLSQRHASDVPGFSQALRERLNAMARSNLLLRGLRPGDEATVQSVIAQSLEPFDKRGTARIELHGPAISVSGQAVVLLSLILHELGTNAVKYGAFSVQDGQIRIDWKVDGSENEKHLEIRWQERGGPCPKPQDDGEGGFGSVLVRKVIGAVRGSATLRFPPEGAVADLMIPLSAITPKQTEESDGHIAA